MTEIRSVSIEMAGAERPTAEGILKHFRSYGLTEKIHYSNGKKVRYKRYKKFATDPLIQVAFDYLGEEGYVQVVEGVGYGEFAKDAREDYRQARAEDGDS